MGHIQARFQLCCWKFTFKFESHPSPISFVGVDAWIRISITSKPECVFSFFLPTHEFDFGWPASPISFFHILLIQIRIWGHLQVRVHCLFFCLIEFDFRPPPRPIVLCVFRNNAQRDIWFSVISTPNFASFLEIMN